jgi:hypothetical protein
MKFPKLSKQKTHQRWTDFDRKKLREFAQTGISDRMIARVMGRTEGAVKWQRRELRIRKAKLKSRGIWRPFISAPKDGTDILVWRYDAGVFMASYIPSYGDGDHGEFGMDHNGPECWFSSGGEDLTGDLPEEWTPLPKHE